MRYFNFFFTKVFLKYAHFSTDFGTRMFLCNEDYNAVAEEEKKREL